MIDSLGLPLPRDTHDTDSAQALVALGWERVAPVVPQILEWVQDMNRPVARVFQPFLVAAGARLAPFMTPIFSADDDTWKYHLLAGIVGESPELASALHNELERMAGSPTEGELLEEVAALAQEILANLVPGKQRESTGGLTRQQARAAIRENCGEGWLPLVDEVFERLPAHISITCAFQKWGALRFDFKPHDDEAFDDYLDDVAERSLAMCETCGAAGVEMIIDDWTVTRCDLHSAGWVWRSDQP